MNQRRVGLTKLKDDDDLKYALIQLHLGKGLSVAAAARQLDIGIRNSQEFFSGEKKWAAAWWEKNGEAVDKYFEGFKDKVVIPEHQIGIWPPYKSEEDDKRLGFKFDSQMKFDEIVPSVDPKWPNTKKVLKDIRGKDSGEGNKDKPLKICIVADTQAKPNVSLEYMKWIGKYIFDKKPDIVVHIGDAYDFESLSSYDKGKKSFEGRRLKVDIEAGNESMRLLLAEFQKDGYNPRLIFCTGNHEARFDRLAEEMPELDGFVGTDTLPLAEMGWEVQPFLKPINIEGIFFVHYLANPMTGKPYGGTAMNQLKTVGNSFVVGHKQCLDVAIRPTLDGKHQIGIINGAAYDFEEPYKGYTGNNHFRGITMLYEVKDGFGLPMFISLDCLKNRYED